MNENKELNGDVDNTGSIPVDGHNGLDGSQADVGEMEVQDAEEVDSGMTESDMEIPQRFLQNIPYYRIYNENGEFVNPLSKNSPYLNYGPSRSEKRRLIRKATKHPKNNKKGIRLIVTPFAKGKFVKTYVEAQIIPLLNGKTKQILHNRVAL